MMCYLAIRALEFLHGGNALLVGEHQYQMTEAGDLVIVAYSDRGDTFYMRADHTVGQWMRLINELPDHEKYQVVFQIGIKA